MIGWLLRAIGKALSPEPIEDPAPSVVAAQEAAPPPAHPTGNMELDPVTGREIPKQSEL